LSTRCRTVSGFHRLAKGKPEDIEAAIMMPACAKALEKKRFGQSRGTRSVNSSTLAATTLAVAVAAGTGSIASPKRLPAWYSRLRKPPYQPTAAVFPVVWTALYGDIAATSAVAIDRLRTTGQHDKARRYVAALGVNLLLNAGWSWLFFRYQRLGASALGAAVLTASSADLGRRTGPALSPYPLWCAFATVLATHVWLLNR
jgi:tryptophan-rich sensory protein